MKSRSDQPEKTEVLPGLQATGASGLTEPLSTWNASGMVAPGDRICARFATADVRQANDPSECVILTTFGNARRFGRH